MNRCRVKWVREAKAEDEIQYFFWKFYQNKQITKNKTGHKVEKIEKREEKRKKNKKAKRNVRVEKENTMK